MRRIDLKPYEIHVDGRIPAKTAADLMGTPEMKVIEALAKKIIGVSIQDFDSIVAGVLPKQPEETTVPYDIRGSIVEILFHPELQLRATGLLDQEKLARKIQDWPDTDLLLEEEEYKKVKTAVDCLSGLNRNDVEFVQRIVNAPIVEVQPKIEPQKS